MSASDPYQSLPEVRIAHPEWSKSAAIYQINTRQFTPEGTLRAAEAQLPRLRDLGITIIWLMPVHPIGEVNRKGALGSPYAVRDYYGVNPEFGTLDDLKAFVRAAHDLGLYVILDWVANHSAWGCNLVTEHPEWYARDKVFAVFNLSDRPQVVSFHEGLHHGPYTDYTTGETTEFAAETEMELECWEYRVFTHQERAMNIWDDLVDGLWPEDPDEGDSAVTYLHKRLDAREMRRALDAPLSPDIGAGSIAAMQNDWASHYRFTYGLVAAFVFAPEDPAQWFVNAGLNKYPEKARDVLSSLAILEQRLEAIGSLLPERHEPATGMNSLAREWIIVQANPAWVLARWVMQIAVGLREAGDYSRASDLLRGLPNEQMVLLQRYEAALELLVAAGKQAVLEAIERPK